MSEYQYHEFLAVDTPLNAEEMASLRRISSRARITPVSFANSYNWGDLKADPIAMLARYFDVYVYTANWMTAKLSIRLPLDALTLETAELMTTPESLKIDKRKNCWIITWAVYESENYGRFEEESGEGWMGRLAPLRDELLRGDLRSLYIGWLAWASLDITEDNSIREPMRPSGLGKLTTAQQALADFIEVDVDLLAGACAGDAALNGSEPDRQATETWLRAMPYDDLILLLADILDDRGSTAERELRLMHAAWLRTLKAEVPADALRSLEELRKNSDLAAAKRMKREQRAQEQLEKKLRMQREQELEKLSKDFPAVWDTVDQTLQRASGLAYQQATKMIVDLSEAYSLYDTPAGFTSAITQFMKKHTQRKTFVRRLVDAGLWK
jgi:hypothetical protein